MRTAASDKMLSLAALLALSVWAACPGHHLPLAQASLISLRNGSLIVSNATCTAGPGEEAAFAAVTFAAAANATGLTERAEYAQAYLCEDGVSLCDGRSDVLQSYATIDANNTYVVSAPNQTYESMELNLLENNTLALDSGGNVTFYRSTVNLRSTNWFYVLNSTSAFFNFARLNFSNYLAWAIDTSFVSVYQSILDFKDTVLYGSNATVNLVSATWNVTSDGLTPPPALYEGKVAPLVWFDNSNIYLEGSLVQFSNISALLLTNSALFATDSTIQLFNTTAELWLSSLYLDNSRIELYNSTLALYCGSSAGGEATLQALSPSASAAANASAAPALGSPLGSVDLNIASEPSGDLLLGA